jgi:hypothetical protein
MTDLCLVEMEDGRLADSQVRRHGAECVGLELSGLEKRDCVFWQAMLGPCFIDGGWGAH